MMGREKNIHRRDESTILAGKDQHPLASAAHARLSKNFLTPSSNCGPCTELGSRTVAARHAHGPRKSPTILMLPTHSPMSARDQVQRLCPDSKFNVSGVCFT